MDENQGRREDRPAEYRLGLVGWPLEHSFSPLLHQAALRAAGLEGVYDLFPVRPDPQAAERLQHLVSQLRTGRLDGLNVTIPHKRALIPWLDRLTPTAQATGAVNTLFRDGDEVVGDNTDVPGFLGGLRPLALQTSGQALVLGAGGAARAVAYALAFSGWRVHVAARRPEQAQQLAREIGSQAIQALPLTAEDLAGLTRDCRLIVNCTPLGMPPFEAVSPWPEALPLPAAAVYDLVYNPPVTELMASAHALGLRAENGQGMLVEQAALSFQRWTGIQAARDAMKSAIAAMVTGEGRSR